MSEISDSETTANWQNSTLAKRDDLGGFVSWLKARHDIEQPIKDVVSSMVTAYQRGHGR